MRAGLTRLKQNRLVRAATILVGGPALAQAVAVIALPLLTRLYTPEHFSILAVYTGLLMICSTPACLRLDIAIPMPESDYEAANLLALALGFSLVTSLFLVVPILVVGNSGHQQTQQPYSAELEQHFFRSERLPLSKSYSELNTLRPADTSSNASPAPP